MGSSSCTTRKDPDLCSIPAVVLTTSKEDADRFNSFSKNVAGYMVKPVDYGQFVEVMRKIRDYWMMSESAHWPSFMTNPIFILLIEDDIVDQMAFTSVWRPRSCRMKSRLQVRSSRRGCS
jgi:DNA-binding response OmpR family regulator